MAESEPILGLRRWRDGSYTRVVLRETTPTVARPKEPRSPLGVPSWWSGAPLDVALCVGGTKSGSWWLEVWDEVLARTRGRHLGGIRVNHETLAAQVHDDR
jgi:hypothetical protein